MPTLQKLNPTVYLFRPPDEALVERTDSPPLIMLFAWMNARLQHEQKYIEALHERYPAATILLIKSTSWYWFSSQQQLEETLKPVIDVLRSRHWDGVLIHMFSNGGGWMFTALHDALSKQTKPDSGLDRSPRVVFVLDSMPGDYGLESLLSFAAPKNAVLYLLSLPIFATAYGLWASICTLRGNPPLFSHYRRTLLTPDPLPTITNPSDPKAPRLYVYSVKDRIVLFRNVERHIEEAKGMGLAVNVEKYEVSPHVGHMRSDEKRYWDAVYNVWATAKL